MTRDEMKILTEQILDLSTGSLDEDLFDDLLEGARVLVEESRDWRQLVKEDSSQTANAGDDHTTSKGLPADWRRFVRRTEKQPQMLLVSGNSVVEYQGRPFAQRFVIKNVPGFFVADVANSVFYLTGGAGKSYTIHQYYIYDPGQITDANEWPFPSRFHRILPYLVASMHSGDVDYDDVNSLLSRNQNARGMAMYKAMVSWDTRVALSEVGV